jgi:hypothetical protein
MAGFVCDTGHLLELDIKKRDELGSPAFGMGAIIAEDRTSIKVPDSII